MRARAIVAMMAAGLGACSTDPGTGPLASTVRQGDVEFSAVTLVMESFPVQLSTTVTMRNRSTARSTLELGSGCPVQLRVYRDAVRKDLVWDQGRVMACTKEIQIVNLAEGDTVQRAARASAYDILGDSLPDGRYHLGAYVQVIDSPLVIPAGDADLAVPR